MDASVKPACSPAYALVILDFDGTLADTFPWFASVLNEVAARYRFRPVAAAEVEALRGCGAREVLVRLGIARWKVPFIARHMRRRAAAARAAFALFPGMAETLRAFDAAGVRLALVSSNREATVRHVLGPELAGRIGFYRCGTALFGKAAAFRGLLAAAGVAPSAALAVGDETRDLAAARKAGLAFGAVGWGYMSASALAAAGPDHLFATAAELQAAVLAGPAAR